MKRLLFYISVVILASVITTGLMAYDNHKDQVRRINLSLTQPEIELILRSLGKLPLEESANLYFNIQAQAQSQLSQAPAIDSASSKKGKR